MGRWGSINDAAIASTSLSPSVSSSTPISYLMTDSSRLSTSTFAVIYVAHPSILRVVLITSFSTLPDSFPLYHSTACHPSPSRAQVLSRRDSPSFFEHCNQSSFLFLSPALLLRTPQILISLYVNLSPLCISRILLSPLCPFLGSRRHGSCSRRSHDLYICFLSK